MAGSGCALHRALTRSRPGPDKASSSVVCREFLQVVDLQRYSRDLGSAVYFPQAVLSGDDLYDVTVTDGDCRLRVTLDPGLNWLAERNFLRRGAMLQNATFTSAMTARLPETPGAGGERDSSYRLVSVEVRGHGGDDERRDLASLPWFGSSAPGPLVPLRANRITFLPLWNNTDYSGEVWRETPPIDEEEEEDERPGVTVCELRDTFLSGCRSITGGGVTRHLIVRIINKSHLMYFGKVDRNCECPYKAVLEVCDRTGSVCVVLWNSVCVGWFRSLQPGQIVRLSRYRVKQHYHAQDTDIEISVNSRNPEAQISILPESSVSPDCRPPTPTYSFCSRNDLLHWPHEDLCDVIGVVTFSGRPERIRSKSGRGAELLEYRWLRLEDGTSDQPIMVKLFSTSQPETHHKLHPLSVVVCTRMKLIRTTEQSNGWFYLTNTTYTQVYCTGLGHHSKMPYRKLRPVRQFLEWLKSQDDGQMLSKSLVGGFFIYPPPAVSLETYMKDKKGEPGFLRGAELEREVGKLCYRERHNFCIQATVTMVMYCRRGEWRSSPCCAMPSQTILFHKFLLRATSSQLLRLKRHFLRLPLGTFQPDQDSETVALFEASMEFLEKSNNDEDDEDDDDDEDASSFVTAPLIPAFPPMANETLPLRYSHAQRDEQAAAVAMGVRVMDGRFDSALQSYYTLRLRALSDSVLVDAIFLPHSPPSSSPLLPHSNSWISILAHGAFSSHTPPPSPADLISMTSQLANRRLVCILEACPLGGDRTEIILSRAFPLTD
ncbi:RPA-related protein RADX [Diretmus argenteus]